MENLIPKKKNFLKANSKSVSANYRLMESYEITRTTQEFERRWMLATLTITINSFV